jgi:HEPN domain-containing protein
MSRARSALQLARAEGPSVYLEDLCYQAQQAAEKAVKALLIDADVSFPYVHDLAQLLTVLEEEGAADVPEQVKEAERLTRFAVFTRYPGAASPVDREEYEEALRLAEGLVEWAEAELRSGSTS